jgi:hypothetical protein
MKYILITIILLTSAHTAIAMEPLYEKRITSYYAHLNHVKAVAQGKPAITLINNDKEEGIWITMGNRDTDFMKQGFAIRQRTLITLCPYLFPDRLNTQQIHNGTTIELSVYTRRVHCFVPYINGNLATKIKNGMFGTLFIKNKNKTYIIHNAKRIQNGIILTMSNPLEKNMQYFNLHIGGDSIVQFGDTITINTSKNNIHIIHNNTQTLATFPITNSTLYLDRIKAMHRRHTV